MVVDLPAIRPEQAEHLAGIDVEVDAPHRGDVAGVRLLELFHVNHSHTDKTLSGPRM
jgi:hypothetical protein